MRCFPPIYVLFCAALFSTVTDQGEQQPAYQSRIDWLGKNSIGIRSIDPDDNDFSDLVPLKSVLAKVRIIQLGEDYHGDGASLWAKQRLVRFLHEEMGFDILAWENGFFPMEEMNNQLDSGQLLQVDHIWGEAGLTKLLYDYVRTTRKTAHPLHFTGIDVHFGMAPVFQKRLFEFLDRYNPDLALAEDRQAITEFLAILYPLPIRFKELTEERHVRWQAAIGRVRDALRQNARQAQNAREFEFLARSLDGLASLEEQGHIAMTAGMGLAMNVHRGRTMGENLISLARDYYPNQKIIVWAHSGHISRNISTIDFSPSFLQQGFGRSSPEQVQNKLWKEYKEIGNFIHDAFGDDAVYCIQMLPFQGSRGLRWGKPFLVDMIPDSLESLLHETNQKYSFVDFRSVPPSHWLRTPQMAHIGVSEARAVWPDVFDGLFFIDTMFPNNESGDPPAGVRTKRAEPGKPMPKD
jgi:erythromycin esterase